MKTLSIPLALALLIGCTSYKGAKVVEGTDLAVGINIPTTENTAKLDILNYLSGFRLGIDQNCQLNLTYSVCESNSYFGVISTSSTKAIKASVSPTETEANHSHHTTP